MASPRKDLPAPEPKRAFRIDDASGFLMRRAYQRACAVFQSVMGDPDITPPQFTVLVKLQDERELSQNHLGRLVAMDPATIQGVVQRLKSRGLIAARPDPSDKRRTLLRLSPAGEDLIETLLERAPGVTQQILAPLSPEEQSTFLALLRRLT